MVCRTCGASLAGEVNFCTACGTQMVAAKPMYAAYPPTPLVPRVQRNLQALGILWCVFGAYRIVAGLMGMFVLRVMTLRSFGSEGWPLGGYHHYRSYGPSWLSALLPVIAVYTVCVATMALLVGYSLLTRRPWGRTLAIVVGILALLKPILGTALGIYTLWALAPAASGVEYEAIADRSGS
jgi:hypothetical protein